MVQGMMEITSTGKNMEQELSSGLIIHNILENFITIIFMGKECILGAMEGSMKESGKIIKCMGKVPLLGQMEGNMWENILMIKSRDMENLFGQMEDLIREIGFLGNSMVKEYM